MLRTDLLDIVRHAVGRGLPVSLAVCGMLLDAQAAEALREAGVRRVSISVDGATAGTHDHVRGQAGSFEACMKAVSVAHSAGLATQINTTVAKHNLAELPAIIDLVKRIGSDTWNPFLLVPTGRGREMVDAELSADEYERTLRWLAAFQDKLDVKIRVTCAPHYQRILRQRTGHGQDARATHGRACPVGDAHVTAHATGGCLGGKAFAFISHTGVVQICGFLDVACGDLRSADYDFRGIWRDSPVLQKVRNVDAYAGKCGRCDYRAVCGGCRARAFASTGDYLAAEPLCAYEPQRR